MNSKLWGTRKSPGKLRIGLVIIFTVVTGILVGIHTSQEPKSLPPIVQPKIKLAFCIEDNGLPCAYKPGGIHDAMAAGALGPRHVVVPTAVRKAIRAAVHRRGPRFEARVKRNIPMYQQAFWLVNCLPSIGVNMVNGKQYPRCASPAQMKARWGRIRSVTTGCAGQSLVAAGVGGVLGDKRLALLAALGGAVTCEITGLFNVGRKALIQDGWGLGLKSAVPGSHWLPVTLKYRW